MISLSFRTLQGTLYESMGGFKYQFKLTLPEFEWVLMQLELIANKDGDQFIVKDDDDQEDNPILGKYSDSTFNTDIKITDYVSLQTFRRLNEVKHLKKNGTLDFRKLIGKATKRYQALMVQGTYGSPVAGDVAGSPTQTDGSDGSN